jgi:hypothetical protein
MESIAIRLRLDRLYPILFSLAQSIARPLSALDHSD